MRTRYDRCVLRHKSGQGQQVRSSRVRRRIVAAHASEMADVRHASEMAATTASSLRPSLLAASCATPDVQASREPAALLDRHSGARTPLALLRGWVQLRAVSFLHQLEGLLRQTDAHQGQRRIADQGQHGRTDALPAAPVRLAQPSG